MKKIISVGVIILLIIVGVLFYNKSSAPKITSEVTSASIDQLVKETQTPSPSASSSLPVKSVIKNIWGNCIESTSSKIPFSFENMKAVYGGAVEQNRFALRFLDSAQVRIRGGKLTSLCGASLDQINAVIKALNLSISKMHSSPEETMNQWAIKSGINLNSDYIITIPANSNIDLLKVSIEMLYNTGVVERISLMPIPVPMN